MAAPVPKGLAVSVPSFSRLSGLPGALDIREAPVGLPHDAAGHRLAQATGQVGATPSAPGRAVPAAALAVGALAMAGVARAARRHRRRALRARRQSSRVRMAAVQHASGRKPKVVVLGTGWAAVSFLLNLTEEEAGMYDITVVSPRNHFLYTPLLPTVTMGSIEERSIVTPIREISGGKAEFLEAMCKDVDPVAKKIQCVTAANVQSSEIQSSNLLSKRFPDEEVPGKLEFELDYDILVYTVGAEPNDFGCPGVKEYAFLFKEVEDARNIRNKVSDVFEKASLPMTTDEEKKALLSFVIVGGGPTGVEVAADLSDFIRNDVDKLYPKLAQHVKIHLVDTADNLLSTYDRKISDQSLETFQNEGVDVLQQHLVKEVTDSRVKMLRLVDKEAVELEYGVIVWCTGIKQRKLSQKVEKAIVQMNANRPELKIDEFEDNRWGIVVDENLQVKGSFGTMYALGDCATVQGKRITRVAEELFAEGDTEGRGFLTVDQMKELFRKNADVYPQLEDYADYFNTQTNEDQSNRVRVVVQDVFANATKAGKEAGKLVRARASQQRQSSIEECLQSVDITGDRELDLEGFKMLLRGIDRNLRSFPATAQVAAQQGKYLAKVFATGVPCGDFASYQAASEKVGPFTYFHKGALAYLGSSTAAFDVPVIGALTGPLAGLAWKGYETISQVTWKNRALVGWDWLRTEIFGRDTSRF